MSKRANGEGTIYKRRDGRWTARLSLPGGKRKDFLGKTRQEVARRLTTAMKARQDGLPIVGERETVGPFLARWLETSRPALRYTTWRRYEELVRIHAQPGLGRVPLARLSPDHLQRLYSNRQEAGLSPGTIRQLHAVLRRALGQATRWGLVARNVAALVTPPRNHRREMLALSAQQTEALLGAAKEDRLEGLYVLAVTTGMRKGELLALHWPDVDLDRGAVQVRGSLQPTPEGLRVVEPKTSHSRRQVALTRKATEALRRHRARQAEERLRLGAAWEDYDLVFTNAIGRPLDAANLSHHSFATVLRRAGLPSIRFHDLRHTAATLMLSQGVHPKVASEMLGHSQIAITLDLYSHVTPTMQRQAAEALDALLGG